MGERAVHQRVHIRSDRIEQLIGSQEAEAAKVKGL
jgi:hypothetical protein